MKEKKATLSVKVPEQVHARIREVADKYGVSIATVVRWALAAYLEAEGLPEAGRALEANGGPVKPAPWRGSFEKGA